MTTTERRPSAPRVTRRRLLAGATAAGAGLSGVVLASCAGPGAGSGQEAASKPPVTLTFLSWRPPAMDQFAPFWQEYSQKHN
ncbi:MAG: hypothetical protein ACRDJN_04600, partial [Chloroflexota bacterium]